MAMDIELRNALGALTGQVQELIKQSSNMDKTLNSAFGKGAQAAAGMTESIRTTRKEFSLTEEMSGRLGRAWLSQITSIATGAIGATALWQVVTNQINAAIQAAENQRKVALEYADSGRPTLPPAILPEMKQGILSTTPAIDPLLATGALGPYLAAGGPATNMDAARLGSIINAKRPLNLDVNAIASQYGKLRGMGVTNPEDVIIAMIKQGKSGDINRMSKSEALAMAKTSAGSWNKAIADSRIMAPEDHAAWIAEIKSGMAKREELQKGMDTIYQNERNRVIDQKIGFTGPVRDAGDLLNRQRLIEKRFPGMTTAQINEEIDKEIRSNGIQLTEDAKKYLPENIAPAEDINTNPTTPTTPSKAIPHWTTTVPRRESPQVAPPRRAELIHVVIDADNRPGYGVQPVNQGH